jgi:hypothetical protein
MSVIAEQKYLVLLNVQRTVPTHSSLRLVSESSHLYATMLTWVQVVDGEPSDPRSEALIKPQLTPPVHRNQVAEPLVGKLMSHNVGHSVSVAVCGCLGVKKYSGGAGKSLVDNFSHFHIVHD